MSPRISLALSGGLFLPAEGRIAAFAPRIDTDLSDLPKDQVEVIQPFKPDHDHFERLGYACATEPTGPYTAAFVFLPRAKAQARAMIATAAAATQGPVVVDGQKTDGIDSILKDMRKRGDVSDPISKAHGKLFWGLIAADSVKEWRAEPRQISDGYWTAPGVFSADGIDLASALLAASLPAKLGADVADLGAGWGFLSRHILEREGVRNLHLVEADFAALACARRNVTDPRAHFHWADATQWKSAGLDTVVMNPPFHTARAADPALGRAFIAAAARLLTPSGHLWMVANRHLPYEAALAEHFRTVDESGGDKRFKVFHATRPLRKRA